MQMNLKSVNDSLATKKFFAFKFQNCVHFFMIFLYQNHFSFQIFYDCNFARTKDSRKNKVSFVEECV